ncbi:MAG: hypothetical protein K1V96_00865 [Lachnospiraceae bacterium]
MDIQILKDMANIDITTVSRESLIDIKNVTINTDKEKQERILDFFQQIKNPYCFICNGMIVKMNFNSNEKTLGEKLDGYFLSL